MRRRDRTPMTEDVARDLAAIDAALAGEPAAGELAELALAVRDERPRPDAGVVARLDERAAEGFAPRTAASGARRRRSVLPALAVAGALLLALVVGVTALNDDGTGGDPVASLPTVERMQTTGTPDADVLEAPREARSGSSTGSGTARATPPAAAAPQTAMGEESADAAPAPAPSASPSPSRSVERGATLALVTTPAKLDEVASGVVSTTDELRGYVVSSSVESRGADGAATFNLRVPSAQLQTALARLSKLARVRSRAESSLDITGRVVAARDQVDALTAERRGVLRQLAAATTPADTDQARERLRIIDVRLARAQAARKQLRNRAAFSTIDVEVATRRASGAVVGGGDSTWTPGDALHDALHVLSLALGAALVALAALLPAGLLAAAGWGLWRVFTARRRNGVLDAAR